MCVYVYAMCGQVPEEARRGYRSIIAGVTVSWEMARMDAGD